MSRTFRNKRPRMQLGSHLNHKQNKRGFVRDGTPQYFSKSCEHHGGCPICKGNRLHSAERRKPLVTKGDLNGL